MSRIRRTPLVALLSAAFGGALGAGCGGGYAAHTALVAPARDSTTPSAGVGPGGTGASVRISGFEEWRFAPDGLIAESLGHFDESSYQRQLNAGSRRP